MAGLDKEKLHGLLIVFGDPQDATFTGMPATRDDARTAWAHAFGTYIQDLIEVTPPLTPPGGTVVLTGVEQAFHDALSLAPSLIVAVPAADLAAAWRAGVSAIVTGPGASDGTTMYTFTGWPSAELDTREQQLIVDLTKLFVAPALEPSQRLGDIAGALHDATAGLTSSAPPVAYD